MLLSLLFTLIFFTKSGKISQEFVPRSSIFQFQNPLLYKKLVYCNKINRTTYIISAEWAYVSPINKYIAFDFEDL